MTNEKAREEAIKIFEYWIKEGFPYDGGYAVEELDVDEKKACKMAIQALSQEPTEKPMTVDEMEREYEKSKALFQKIVECDDAVSREAVIKCLERGDTLSSIDHRLVDKIKRLPSVTVRQTGEWINLEKTKYKGQLLPFWGRYECSACKGHGQDDFNFCPTCGACMKDGRTLDEFIEDNKESEK